LQERAYESYSFILLTISLSGNKTSWKRGWRQAYTCGRARLRTIRTIMMQPKTILNPPMDTDGAIPCVHMPHHERWEKAPHPYEKGILAPAARLGAKN